MLICSNCLTILILVIIINRILYLLFLSHQVKLHNETNLRKKAESSAATAEEKAKLLEEKLSQLSGSVDREKKRLNSDIAHLGKEAKLSVSRIGADVSIN